MEKHIPETLKPVSLLSPETTDGGAQSSYLDLKNAHMAYLVVNLKQAAADETVITVEEREEGESESTVENDVRIWADHDVDDDNEELERRDDAKTYTVPNEDDDMLIIFQVDPRALKEDSDQVRVTFSNSGESTNFASVVAYTVPRYQG